MSVDFESRENAKVYHVFFTQKEAEHISNNAVPGTQLPLFSYDKKNSRRIGAKKFVVGSYSMVHSAIKNKKDRGKKTHFYEIMIPGRPTYLYIDAEYCKTTNGTADEASIHKKFMVEVIKLM